MPGYGKGLRNDSLFEGVGAPNDNGTPFPRKRPGPKVLRRRRGGAAMSTKLIKYDAACHALAEAKTTDEVMHIRDKAEGMRAYAKMAKNREMEMDAAEIRMRAERRLGEMIRAQKETVGLGSPGFRAKLNIGSPRNPMFSFPPSLAEAGIDKHLANCARELAAVPEEEFEGMIAGWREDIVGANTRVTTNLLRAGERARRDVKLDAQTSPWAEGRYPVIYADPPWRYDNHPTGDRIVENHYPTMPIEEICALPVSGIATDDAVLYLWATSPLLPYAFQVIEAWGFEYRSSMVWVKPSIGLGYWARTRHELLLIAKRGNFSPPAPADRPDSVVFAPRGRHSAKPHVLYEIIERSHPGLPKIELFCRTPRKGWAVWGNEVPEANAA